MNLFVRFLVSKLLGFGNCVHHWDGNYILNSKTTQELCWYLEKPMWERICVWIFKRNIFQWKEQLLVSSLWLVALEELKQEERIRHFRRRHTRLVWILKKQNSMSFSFLSSKLLSNTLKLTRGKRSVFHGNFLLFLVKSTLLMNCGFCSSHEKIKVFF